MKFRERNRGILLILLMIFILMVVAHSLAEGPKKVAILPFKINAAEDLTYLQDGIVDMLGSRLAWKGEVEILEKGLVRKKITEIGGTINQDKAVLIGQALKADYVILGSLTVFGESVSIDARIMDVTRAEELVTAFNQSKGMDEVIPTVNQFALDINEKIMGRVIQPRVEQIEEKRGLGGLLGAEDTIEAGKPNQIQAFNVQMVGLDVGDVDGDGQKEIVFVDDSNVYIYKLEQQTFKLFKQIKGRLAANYVYVSLGDINRNGRDEIYVSNPVGEGISSFVLEWNGSDFKEIADKQPWFFRFIEIPGRGANLIGQRREIRAGFQGKVERLTLEKDHYIATGPLQLPSMADVFNFALFEPDGKDVIYSVILGSQEYLRLFNPGQKEIWRSEDHFGGTYTFIDIPTVTPFHDDRQYFSSPIYITDLDENGEPEVMVCKNTSTTGRLIGRYRGFSNGEVYFFTWDEAGLTMKWKTRKQSGPVVGYRVVDLNGDGIKELVVALVPSQDVILSGPRSRIVVYYLK